MKGHVNIFYHFGKGKIVAKQKVYDRADLVGKARSDEGIGEKE
jgi:predicted ester cyclase